MPHSCGASKLLTQNLFSFLGHIQRATIDYMTDVARANNGLSIHRPKKKSNLLNEARIKACINKFDSGAYDRLQFLTTVSHILVRTLHLFTTVPPVLTTTTTTTSFLNRFFPTDAAATPATAASTSSSPEVAHCCEVCVLLP